MSGSDPSSVALRCRSLAKSFAGVPAVQDMSFDVPSGTLLALLGPSGCGKTTAMRLIAGFEDLDAGRIEIGGRIVAGDGIRLAPERRRVGMVFQDYAIFPHLSAGRNVGFALPKAEASRARVAELLELVGLTGYADKMPHELSGGEQQRVALARALSTKPDVLLLDEPFSNLDAALRAGVREEVRELLKRNGTTAVFVTHDQEEALALGDQVGVMNQGRLEQIDSAEDIFYRPRTRFVAQFLGQTEFVSGEVTAAGIETPLGTLGNDLRVAHGTALDIGVRPADVTLMADKAGLGLVTARRFTGFAYVYRVAMDDGTILHSREPHETSLSEGTRVRVSLRPGRRPLLFHGGQALRPDAP